MLYIMNETHSVDFASARCQIIGSVAVKGTAQTAHFTNDIRHENDLSAHAIVPDYCQSKMRCHHCAQRAQVVDGDAGCRHYERKELYFPFMYAKITIYSHLALAVDEYRMTAHELNGNIVNAVGDVNRQLFRARRTTRATRHICAVDLCMTFCVSYSTFRVSTSQN